MEILGMKVVWNDAVPEGIVVIGPDAAGVIHVIKGGEVLSGKPYSVVEERNGRIVRSMILPLT